MPFSRVAYNTLINDKPRRLSRLLLPPRWKEEQRLAAAQEGCQRVYDSQYPGRWR